VSEPLPGDWADRVADRLGEIRDGGRWRSVRTLDGGRPATTISATGTPVVSFAANDYLGLSQHPDVIAAAHDALDRYGAGSGAARLIVGGRPVHDELEAALATWKGAGSALLFSTGYQANVGVLGALAGATAGCVVHSDELNHASIIDGARLARADVAVFPHRDLGALDAALDAGRGRSQLVVSDEVFSMDGDVADVAGLADLCRAHGALLVLDVAHSVLGTAAPSDAIVVGTLSKALGSLGGFVAGPTDVVDLCRNAARSFIFTTATSPADAAAALAAVRIVCSPEGDDLRATLLARIDELSPGHPSPVIPVMLGPESAAVAASEALLAEGLLVPAIRPPTVAPGTSRLRIALSAAHDHADVRRLGNTLDSLGLRG
jgi:8-amino-7-oxononanoate synthase